MTAHTPGPWVIADSDPTEAGDTLAVGTPSRTDPDRLNELIAEVWPTSTSSPQENKEANAHLIAAAPELLEALNAVCDHYVDVNTPFEDDDERRVVALADRAMAKAGGRTEGRAAWQQAGALVEAANLVLGWIDRAIPREQLDNEAVAALREAVKEVQP